MGYACPYMWVSTVRVGVFMCVCVCMCIYAAREYRVLWALGGEQIFDGFGNCALTIARDSHVVEHN